MKNKIKLCFFIILTACIFVSGLCGCVFKRKYFLEFKASYSYDKTSGLFIKFPSEIKYESNEIISISYENNKTQIVNYDFLEIKLPKRDYYTGEASDYNISVAYTLYNGNLIFPEIPMQYSPHNYYIIKNNTESVIITIDDDNAFLVNLKTAAVTKLYDDSSYLNYFEKIKKGDIKKLIYAKTISISPDGKYLLYVSNRNYIKDGVYNSLDIYSYNIQTGQEKIIMNFTGKEFLCWEKSDINPNSSGNFLFRESNTSKTDGKRYYSAIKRYSLTQEKEDIFLKINSDYNNYEMIDDQFIYIFKNQRTDENGEIIKENIIYIADIYSKKIRAVNLGQYSSIWHVTISENKEYLALFALYININGVAIPEMLTVHIETNDLLAQYEQTDDNYFIDTFYWCPDNILAVNFLNTINLYNDLCRLHNINHVNNKFDPNNKNNIIEIQPLE